MSSKKLLEQCQKLEKLWSHVFTATLNLNNMTAESQWYTKLTDLIDKQQTAPIWMSESKVYFSSLSYTIILFANTGNICHIVAWAIMEKKSTLK